MTTRLMPKTQVMPWCDHIKATVSLGLPLIGSHLAQMATNTTDVVMLGWYGVEELAATVLATQLWFVIFIVGSGFAFAVMPMVANALGEDDNTSVRRSVRMGLWITVIYCSAAMIPLWFFESILLALGQQPKLAALAQDYMQIAMWAMFPAMLIMVLRSYLAALERTQIVLWATVAGAVANGFMDYAFIFGHWGAPELGVQGAALATIGTTLLSFAFLLGYAAWHADLKKYKLFQRFWRSDWPAFFNVFRLGWPISLTLLAETGMFAAVSIMMGWVGTIALATHGIVQQIVAISFMIPLGLSNVATIRAGRAFGRKDSIGLWRASITVLLSALLTSVCTVVLFLTLPGHLLRLFLDTAEPDFPYIIAYGASLLAIAAAFQVFDAMQVIVLGLLRGIKDTAIPMVLAVISYWLIGVPVGYLLGFNYDYGGIGIWSGLVIGLGFAAITMGIRYYQRLQIMQKYLPTASNGHI